MAPHHVLLAVLELDDSVRGVLDLASLHGGFDVSAHFVRGIDARPNMNPEDIIDTVRKLSKRKIESHLSRIPFPWLTGCVLRLSISFLRLNLIFKVCYRSNPRDSGEIEAGRDRGPHNWTSTPIYCQRVTFYS